MTNIDKTSKDRTQSTSETGNKDYFPSRDKLMCEGCKRLTGQKRKNRLRAFSKMQSPISKRPFKCRFNFLNSIDDRLIKLTSFEAKQNFPSQLLNSIKEKLDTATRTFASKRLRTTKTISYAKVHRRFGKQDEFKLSVIWLTKLKCTSLIMSSGQMMPLQTLFRLGGHATADDTPQSSPSPSNLKNCLEATKVFS